MFLIKKVDNFDNSFFNFGIDLFFILCLAIFFTSFFPEVLFAEESPDVIGGVLCKIYVTFTGRAAKAISAIAILFTSLGALFGKASWGIVMTILSCVACVLASHKIVELIAQAAGAQDYAFSCNLEDY